jgi:hypothetical protein
MFGLLKGAANLAASVVRAPIAAAADLVTLGGVAADRDESYTETNIRQALKALEQMVEDENRG